MFSYAKNRRAGGGGCTVGCMEAIAEDVRALLTRQEVWVLAGAADTASVTHWVSHLHLKPTAVGDVRMFDRRDVERLLCWRHEGAQLERSRRALLRVCLGELEVRGSELRDTGLTTKTGRYLDEELLSLVGEAQCWTGRDFDAFAKRRSAPSSAEIMQRLAIFNWRRLCLRAGLTDKRPAVACAGRQGAQNTPQNNYLYRVVEGSNGHAVA